MTRLSISRAWDESKSILRRNAGLFATIALALFVVPSVISDVVSPATPAGELGEVGYWTVLTVLALLIGLVGQLAVIRLALSSSQTVGEAISHAARRALVYIAATLVWVMPFFLIGGGLALSVVGQKPPSAPAAGTLLLLIAVGFYFAVRMLLTSVVASEEGLGPIATIKRSWSLSRGNWLRLFAFLLLLVIAALIAMTAVAAIIGLLAAAVLGPPEPMTLSKLIVSLASQAVGAAVTVVFMVMLARMYTQVSGRDQPVASVPTTGT
jgi:hypothetical protein